MKLPNFILKFNYLKLFSNPIFFKSTCLIIFLISILVRSLFDIGPDTSVYLDVGKKLAQGKRYYFDILEINFPILMWLYALEYKMATFLHISPVILAEIIVNLLGLYSIFISHKILKKGEIKNDENLIKLIILSFFVGFYLRPLCFYLFEFGTKTSYFLILFYPYLSILLLNQDNISKKFIITKAIIIGIAICIKPHYLLFFLVSELLIWFKNKKFRDLFAIDKVIIMAILLIYLCLIHNFHYQFLYYVIPLWNNFFKIYSSNNIKELYSNASYAILPYCCIFLIYSRYKLENIDKILISFFVGSTLVILSEKIFTFDQFSLFCSINLVLLARIIYIINKTQFFNFKDNLFFLGFFVIVPIAQENFIGISIFGFSGVFNVWWIMIIYYIIIFYKKIDFQLRSKIFSNKNIIIFIFTYVLLVFITAISFNNNNFFLSNLISLILFFICFFIYEKYYNSRISVKLTALSTFMIMASIFMFMHNILDSFINISKHNGYGSKSKIIKDFKVYYYKKFANNFDNYEINFYSLHQIAHPLISYINKENPQKISTFNLNASFLHNKQLYQTNNSHNNFANDYFLRDVKNLLKNPNTKLIFVDNFKINEKNNNSCLIGYIEYYFYDIEFKKFFLKNYEFENRLIINKKYEIKKDFWTEAFNDIDNPLYYGNYNKITEDLEVYVRKN